MFEESFIKEINNTSYLASSLKYLSNLFLLMVFISFVIVFLLFKIVRVLLLIAFLKANSYSFVT